MNKLKNFIIIAETKESYDKLENDSNYLLVKRKEHFEYYKWPIWRELKKYLIKNNNSFKEFDVQQLDGRVKKEVMIETDEGYKSLSDSFRYFDGKLIKLLVDEKNKVIKKYVLYRGVVSKEYAEINKKFITEIFNKQNDEQGSYFKINNYMEFEVNNELMNKRVSEYFGEDVIQINGFDEVGFVDDFMSIKIDSPRVKNILKEKEDLEMTLNLYSIVPVNINTEMKNNEISNLEVNIISI